MAKFKGKYRIESNRLNGFDYTQSFWYFITVCTFNKINHFGFIKGNSLTLNNCGNILEDEIKKTQLLKKADIDSYVIMPNHFHIIMIPQSGSNVGTIIGQIKSITAKRILKNENLKFRWQSNYYDHIIRNEKDLYRIRKYIELNPLKWELDEYYRK